MDESAMVCSIHMMYIYIVFRGLVIERTSLWSDIATGEETMPCKKNSARSLVRITCDNTPFLLSLSLSSDENIYFSI